MAINFDIIKQKMSPAAQATTQSAQNKSSINFDSIRKKVQPVSSTPKRVSNVYSEPIGPIQPKVQPTTPKQQNTNATFTTKEKMASDFKAKTKAIAGEQESKTLPKYGYLPGQDRGKKFTDMTDEEFEQYKATQEWEKNYPDAAKRLKAYDMEIRANKGDFSSTPTAVTLGVLDSLSLGSISRTVDKSGMVNPIKVAQQTNPVAYTVGNIGGYVLPGSAAEKGAAAVLKPITKKIASKVGQSAVTGAVSGAGLAATEGVIRGEKPGDIAKNTLLFAGLGAGTNAALTKIFSKLKSGKAISQEETATIKAVSKTNPEILQLPEVKKLMLPEKATSKIELGPPSGTVAEGKNIYAAAKGTKERPFVEVKGKQVNEGMQPVNLQNFSGVDETIPPIEQPLGTGDINTARAKISYTSPEKKVSITDTINKLKTQLVDQFAPAEKAEKKVFGKVQDADKSFYKQLRLYKGVPERANIIVDKELKPILKEVEKSGFSYKDLGLYAEAVHAKDVNAKGLKSGFTNAEINDTIEKLGNDVMEAARQKLVKYSQDRLKTLAQSGRIARSTYLDLKEKWPNYMPLNREFIDDSVGFSNAIKESFANVGSSIKNLKGSDRTVIDPIESLIKNTYKIETEAAKGRVGLSFIDLATKDTDNLFARKLNDGEAVGRKNVINVKANGENIQYEVTPELYKMMLALDKETVPAWIKFFSKPASVLRAGATLTPDFALRNPIRDVMNAWIVNKSGFNPITDFAVGLASTVKKGKLYEDFIKNSGGYGNILSMDRQTHRKIIEDALKKPIYKRFVTVVNPDTYKNLLSEISNAVKAKDIKKLGRIAASPVTKPLSKTLQGLRAISDITESATKVGVYRAGIRKGFNPAEAAFQARDIMDFARTGNSIQNANRVVAFLNANIQGKSKLIRAIKENPKAVIPKIAASMTLPSVAIYAYTQKFANDEQKALINDSPDWLRDSFWLIPIPGTNQVARMPKPFDVAAVSNVVERFLDYTLKNDKEAFDGIIKRTVKEQSIPVMLTGITPIMEGMANYSFFRQGPIIPQREQSLDYEMQKDAYTSETAKLLAKGVQKLTGGEGMFKNFSSPRIMDNTIKQTTAGLGTYATTAIDAILNFAGITEDKNLPNKNISQKPVIKSFLVNENQTGKSMEFIYDERDKLQKNKNSDKDVQPKALKYLNSKTGKIGDITSEIRKITNDKSILSEDKRLKINKLSQERNKLSIDAEKEFKQVYKVKAIEAITNEIRKIENDKTLSKLAKQAKISELKSKRSTLTTEASKKYKLQNKK